MVLMFCRLENRSEYLASVHASIDQMIAIVIGNWIYFNYLYDDTTGLPVDAYTPEDVETISGVLYRHVYKQYPSVVESVYLSTIYSKSP